MFIMGMLKDAIMAVPEPIVQVPTPENIVLKCDKHGEYDAIQCKTPGGKTVSSECPSCQNEGLQKERYERFREHQRRQAQHKALSIFRESSMPKIFSEITFDDYKPQNKRAAEIKNRLIKYAENFEAIKEAGACALLIGNTGNGKSMLSAAIGNYVMGKGYTCFYTKCPRVLNKIKDTWSPNTEGTQEGEINKYRKFDLVIADEIPKGLKKQNDWELLHEVLERRTDDRLPTISISTLPEEKLREKIGDEVFRRLHHRGHILTFDWEPYQGDPVF